MIKTVLKSFLLLPAMSALFSGCYDCSDTGDLRTTRQLRFRVTDSAGVNIVREAGGKYHPDSIQVASLTNGTLWFKRTTDSPENDIQFELSPPLDGSGRSKLLLVFGGRVTDVDTMEISYQHMQGKCNSWYEYNEYYFNGRPETVKPDHILYFIK